MKQQLKSLSRRDFLKATAATAVAAGTSVLPNAIVAQDDPINLVMWSNFSTGNTLDAVDAMVARFNEENR